MTQITSNVNPTTRNLRASMLTCDTLYHLAEIMTGDRYANLVFTDKECADIEHLAYVSNIGAPSKEVAWERFRDRCLTATYVAIPEAVKKSLSQAKEDHGTLYVVSEQWASEETVYTDAEKDAMLGDLVDWVYEDVNFRADYEDSHANDLEGKDADEVDDCFYDFCVFSIEDAVGTAEYYGSGSIGCLNIRVIRRAAA